MNFSNPPVAKSISSNLLWKKDQEKFRSQNRKAGQYLRWCYGASGRRVFIFLRKIALLCGIIFCILLIIFLIFRHYRQAIVNKENSNSLFPVEKKNCAQIPEPIRKLTQIPIPLPSLVYLDPSSHQSAAKPLEQSLKLHPPKSLHDNSKHFKIKKQTNKTQKIPGRERQTKKHLEQKAFHAHLQKNGKQIFHVPPKTKRTNESKKAIDKKNTRLKSSTVLYKKNTTKTSNKVSRQIQRGLPVLFGFQKTVSNRKRKEKSFSEFTYSPKRSSSQHKKAKMWYENPSRKKGRKQPKKIVLFPESQPRNQKKRK